jgi:hypothetical protein
MVIEFVLPAAQGAGKLSTSIIQGTGFVLTFQRGAEWAATGQVTIPLPADMK